MPVAADPIEDVRARYDRGVALVRRGRSRAAERLLRTALARVSGLGDDRGGAVLRARILVSLAYVEFEQIGLGPALERLDEADGLIRSANLTELRVLLHMQRGILLLRVGQFAAAVAEFDAGAAQEGDSPASDRSILLINRAVAHLELGSVRAARADLIRCLDTATPADRDMLTLRVTHNLGWVEFLSGNLPEALRLMDVAFAMDPEDAPGIALLGKAQVLVEAGLYREADDALVSAAAVFRGQRMFRDLAETELERARCALATGDATAARRLAASARDRFGRRSGSAFRRSAELVCLQAELALGRPPTKVIAQAQQLGAELAEQAIRLPMRVAGLIAAEAQLVARDVGGAEQVLTDLGPSRRDDPITGRMHTHYVHARLEATRGDRAAAARRVRRALDELARYQASFGSIDLRTASAVHGRRLAELEVALAREAGRPASIFAAAERARAVSSRLPAVRPPDDPVAADLLAELRQTLESLRAGEQDSVVSAPLLRRRRELERAILARSWTLAGSGRAAPPAGLAEVAAELTVRDRTMITYVQADGRLSAVVVGPDRPSCSDLGPAAPVLEQVRRVRADLDVLAYPRLPAPIRAAVRTSLQRSLDALDGALLAPLAVDGPLVLVSTGVLGQLPWASLPSLRRRSLVVAPSATKWLASTAGGEPRAGGVIALSGPDLPRADAEIAAVGRAWPNAQLASGGAATTSALTAAIASAAVLHVAAHGVHQPENPLFSSVRMSDGSVFAHELDQQARAPEHVVLSACEVGLSTVRPGDEALGLASVLLQLGTRSVVAGVARVGDEVAAQTMGLYHRKLAAGRDSSVALAEALDEIESDVVPPFVNFGSAWSGTDLASAPGVA